MRTIKFEKDIKLILNNILFNQLIECVKSASPNEACGLVFGDVKEIDYKGEYQYHYVGKKFNCIESNQNSPVAFLMNNLEELNQIFQEAFQKHNLRLISIFHSHPGGTYPSETDFTNMRFLDNCGNNAFKNQIWVIMNARNKKLNGYILFKDKFMQVEVKIKN
ncbi:MAG: Mov34/MPN/PAD-1 family protein [Candidatus Hermodarchaeota archaeon]